MRFLWMSLQSGVITSQVEHTGCSDGYWMSLQSGANNQSVTRSIRGGGGLSDAMRFLWMSLQSGVNNQSVWTGYWQTTWGGGEESCLMQ